jgi:transposase
MQGRKDIQPKIMYQVTLDSLVSKDNFYRQLENTLDLSFIYKETARYYGTEGQESIDPVVFFKICMVGYMNNISSDRRLIEMCSNRLDVRLYLKYDIDESLPWHSTISRTRQLYGEKVFLSLFQRVLSLCVEKGMVQGKRQVIDSAFVKANASLDSLVIKEDVITDAVAYADELNENSEYKIDAERPEEYSPANKESGPDKKTSSNKTHYSTTDPDARMSLKPGKACHLNYYGQIAVDDSHHVITGANADFADKRDSQCLEKVVTQTIENLKQNSLPIEELLTDTGYSSGEALRFIEENSIDAYIPNHGSYKDTREGFIYNKEFDRYECTRGNKAIVPFVKTVVDRVYTKKIYRSTSEKCKDCPLRSSCIGKLAYKKITDSIDKPLYDKMHQKMQTSYGKRMARKRGKTVEPVLGTLLTFMGMKRVNARGIEQANKHVMMAALCYNLKKYIKFIRPKVKSITIALTKEKNRIEVPRFASMRANLSDFIHELMIQVTNNKQGQIAYN